MGSTTLTDQEARQRIGQRLGNYEILNVLGIGGMGVVYRGRHVLLDKPVAVKVLRRELAGVKGSADRMLREARAASRVRHPNIVDITDFGVAPDGAVYFVMEYLEGLSLEDVMERDGSIVLFKAVSIIHQIAHVLGAVHEAGIVHRDLKPENIYLINHEGRRRVVRRIQHKSGPARFVVEREPDYDQVKLLDFGLAKIFERGRDPARTTQPGLVFGTPEYMSPEQARGDRVDSRSDIYALGVIFYRMITGDFPFDGDGPREILMKQISQDPVPPKDCNPEVQVDETTNATILKCLEKDPGRRFQTMGEVSEALADCFTDVVYLRDVHKMPGAVEAGILPDRVERDVRDPVSLTDELRQLFQESGSGEDALARILSDHPAVSEEALVYELMPKDKKKPKKKRTSSGRRSTNVGIGAVGGEPLPPNQDPEEDEE